MNQGEGEDGERNSLNSSKLMRNNYNACRYSCMDMS
jgi:hypothetical protein